jgi:hypothetical protein
MRHVLSPLTLLLLCWGLSGAAMAVTLAQLHRLDLVQTFMLREHLDPSVFGGAGLAWLLLALLVYAVGDTAGRFSRRRPAPSGGHLNPTRAAHLTFALNLVLLGVTALWILTAAAKAGGLINLAAAAYIDSLTTRDILLENKLFTGMRLFYAALPATACMAAALLALGTLPRRARAMMVATLTCNTLALFVLPIVMSQRLLLLQLLLSAYIVACIVRGRLLGFGWMVLALGLFLCLWLAREAITNPMFNRSALDIGLQKLAFYVVNDMWNAFAPLMVNIPHTWGGLNFEGVMFLTFTDGYFARLLTPRTDALDAVLGGGEFPFLTAAYVDFGPVLGALFIAVVAFVIRRVFIAARRSLGFAVVYAQIGAALLFSSHSVYFTHQNFLFSLALIALVVLLSMRRRSAPLEQPATLPLFRSRRRPAQQPPPLPDSVMRHMAVFATQRRHAAPVPERHDEPA